MDSNTTIEPPMYDVTIIGGGLAGLSLSILLSRQGFKVLLFEKEKYPFHRVCGEYISMESWNFIRSLGLDLDRLNLPEITTLNISSPDGKLIAHKLDLGGFGISRFMLDNELYKIAVTNGAEIHQNSKVDNVEFENDQFTVICKSVIYKSRVVAGAFGKRSNLDVKWCRSFTQKKPGKLNNYIGVKYHVKTQHPLNTIALHNFKDGYCGISQIEDRKYCLCYLTTAGNLKANNNSIPAMERNVLQRNPFLKDIFSTSTFLYSSPVTISQISFDRKLPVENHLLMTGDASGMITPLCGNGMSMALHASKIAAQVISSFLQHEISRIEMEQSYQSEWDHQFKSRLRTGRLIQRLFGKVIVTNIFLSLLKPFPRVINRIVKATHGRPF